MGNNILFIVQAIAKFAIGKRSNTFGTANPKIENVQTKIFIYLSITNKEKKKLKNLFKMIDHI